MIVGVFSPVINWCGGAEWVAVNIINGLKEHGHQVIVFTDKPLNQAKFRHVFNKDVLADQQMVFPFHFFNSTNYHNIYTDAIRILMLKSKCRVVIDTFTGALLPGVETAYIHHPLLKKVETALPKKRNKVFFYPYENYLSFNRRSIEKKLVFANSDFTAQAIKAELGIKPYVLYPSVSNELLSSSKSDLERQRENTVITVARICPQKKLNIIPQIAQFTKKDITFLIVGLLDSKEALNSIIRLSRQLKVSERIKIMPNVERKQLRKMLLNSKVYLHTTTNEHFGISIVEAMACGCVPVVPNSGGPKEFVPLKQRYDNVDEAAQIIQKIIDNWTPQQARKSSERAERFGENEFTRQFIHIFNSYFS